MNVLYLSVENSPERVVRPRFDRLGGDPARFHLLTGVFRDLGTGGDLRHMTLSEIGVLEEAIKRTEAKLVIVDPLQSYIDAEINRAGETRPVMDSLCKLAEKNGCAMLLIRHLSKARTGRAIARGIGSIDLTGAVRSEVLAGCSEESPSERALVHVKSNVGELGPAMGYRIEGDGSFCWTGTSLLTASEMLAPEKTVEPFSALSEAEEFLREQLRDGPVALKQLVENASPRRISLRTLERAKSSLGVVARRQGGRSGASYWELPQCEEAPRVEGASRAAAV